VASGSTIAAREETAVLRLARGGEIRVCPNTTVSVATSLDGQSLMLGMNTGAMETHYHLSESSDSILTPDFRVVLPGPGEFNLAVNSDARGDTCVSSLAGTNSSVVVAEVLGNETYEIKPEQQVLFRQGKMQSIEKPVAGCGCPPPQEPVMRATADPTTVLPQDKIGNNVALANANTQASTTAGTGSDETPASVPIATPAGAPAANQVSKVQISAPLVFNAKELAKMRAAAAADAPPPPLAQAAELPFSARQADPLPPLLVLPPTPPPERKGFFGRIGGFFRRIF
jgi:hypothetical protein